MATSLYSHSLTGLVLIVTPSLSYDSNMGKEFIKSCNATTEFHFDSIDLQLQKVKHLMKKPLSTGDFFYYKTL